MVTRSTNSLALGQIRLASPRFINDEAFQTQWRTPNVVHLTPDASLAGMGGACVITWPGAVVEIYWDQRAWTRSLISGGAMKRSAG